MTIIKPSARIKSFVGRNARQTRAQRKAYQTFLSQYGLSSQMGRMNFQAEFGSNRKCFLEIGFGSGQSLLALAKNNPNFHFIGIETHQPGVASLLIGIETQKLTNLRVFHEDAYDVLQLAIPDQSLDGIQLFFPDPWPKRRHHKRRFIQTALTTLLVQKLKPEGVLHIATDWEHYALHILQVYEQVSYLLKNISSKNYSERSLYRPILSKFEARAIRERRRIWELQFKKK